MSYRPRLTSIRDVTSRNVPAPRDANGDIVTDPDACRELLFAVLETAMRDYAFLNQLEERARLTSAQKSRRLAILEDGDPFEFFEGPWFADICYFLSLDPHSVKDLLQDRHGASTLAQAS